MQSRRTSEQAISEDGETSRLLNSIKLKVGSIRRAKQMFSAQLAPDFNIFNYLCSDEMGISRVFADLLDPNGLHGQNKIFLDEFSKKLGEDYQWISSANDWKVKTEKQTDEKKRIDIYLNSSIGVIGIENKPRARDQNNQLSDYAEYLKNNSGGKKWLLIYISNTPPCEDSMCKSDRDRFNRLKNYVELDFNAINDWLSICASKAKALSVRVFIENLIEHIRTNINKETDMTEEAEVLKEVGSSTDSISAAFHIYRSVPKLRQMLMESFRVGLQRRLAENGYFLVWEEVPIARAARYSGFGIKKLETQDKYLRFEFGSPSFNSLLWGVKQQGEKTCDDKTIWPAISQFMSDQFAGGKHNSVWWPWYSLDHGLGSGFNDWWDSEAPWIAINEVPRHFKWVA